MNPYHHLFSALNEAGVRYLVVGGVAVNLHGYSRFTGDVDIVMALDQANLDRLAALMADMGYTQRLPIDVRALSNKAQVRRWITEKGLVAYTFIDPKMPQFGLDILIAESDQFAAFEHNKVMIEAGDLPIPVVSIEDLIGMKKRSNRQKDVDDIAALLSLKGL